MWKSLRGVVAGVAAGVALLGAGLMGFSYARAGAAQTLPQAVESRAAGLRPCRRGGPHSGATWRDGWLVSSVQKWLYAGLPARHQRQRGPVARPDRGVTFPQRLRRADVRLRRTRTQRRQYRDLRRRRATGCSRRAEIG